MFKKRLGKKIKLAEDFIYTLMATVVMQIALQLIIYPLINHFYGESVTGEILYFMGLIYIFPQAAGTALNNTRLVTRKSVETTNGDFTRLSWMLGGLMGIICFAIGFADTMKAPFSLLFGVFALIYTLRMYAQVEFRLTINFKGYFIYYAIVSVGYLIGLGIYALTGIWILIFLTGEVLALVYSLVKGSVFKREQPQTTMGYVVKTMGLILVSLLIRDGVNQFDKVILKLLISAETVTYYNALALVGKSIQMLVSPVNTLIVTYLSKKDARMTEGMFKRFVGIALGMGIVMLLVCQVMTPLYIRLFYHGFYDRVAQYCLLVNSGLIMGFIASLFTVMIMSQGSTKVYASIETVWGICYIVFAFVFTKWFGVVGLAGVTLGVNTIKLIAAILLAHKCLPQSPETEELKEP